MSITISSSISIEQPGIDSSAKEAVGALPADFEALYESALRSLQQMFHEVFAQGGTSEADFGDDADTGMDTQSAAGALAGYMHENGINTLNPDQLYQLAYNPKDGTPSAVSAAAKFMLQNPDVFNQIETHDVAGSDGIASANDFDWAAQGEIGDVQPSAASSKAAQMDTQGASGALAGYMHENGIHTLTPGQLYQLAYNPREGTPPDVSAAAAYMLQNADAYNQIETHDVAGADGISGVGNFDWAAQGGLDEAKDPGETDTADGGELLDDKTSSSADLEQAVEAELEQINQAVFGYSIASSQSHAGARIEQTI
ncbi:hypothetical protein WKR88_15115 [Trinickia caryophylli]|uniref:Uncharacterized protein n=1 Tax=Trinickia caryophylli TaxID=28094 RepID=A0A1X7D6Q7_TRICW|nr:hypothetical protein [Trinickia caryophylli]PMS12672.1 hypothetical protein C0Z17_07505 [Trinickia caryophylli]TRX15079.1 hypothetical protein FNF07_28185 [Trinickia caryophylli]WQE14938.1 hypothetical protein U0034_20510 [Trinickia caryophylli]SMF09886.1 hypothetical protein SAMN06295900_102461 [Trinickia caryophylli]GLU31334.1 hypothetical protein Busp01_11760 [Trinickia caryophylli]